MVLNQDGTPNPLPIIDVYGTRRGPKKKTDADGNPISLPPGGSLSPETPSMVGMPPGHIKLPGSSSKSPTSPLGGSFGAPGAPRFPLLPPFVMAQMQRQMQQSLNQSGSPTMLGQVSL